MRDLNDLYFFVRVVDNGGFAPAARVLGVPKSRLSRRLVLLEQRLGVRLLQRSTRSFAVTEIGREYYRHCKEMLEAADAAQEAIDRFHAEPQGRVRVTCPPGLVHFRIGDLVSRFMDRYPLVQVYLKSTSRPIDVITDSIDVSIRVSTPPLEEGDLVRRILAQSPQRIVASPAFLSRFAPPQTPAELSALPTIDIGPPRSLYQWRLEGPDEETLLVSHQPRLVTDDFVQMRLAALHGIGAAHLPAFAVDDDLATGALVEIMPQWRPRTGIVYVVFPSRRGVQPAVRGMIDFLAAEFARFHDAANGVARNSG
ncbi:LysR substrate-binding domain-containing protein [Methylocystis sp. ATCC 49242]|uniref:LysR substrate-binding domain-containing protein n=1 Tax=Methylocystis sp. ATCC 49242 TaxID=622637 RepID=UPI0001F8847D|nr:LysR substrate-binding domain-containing protein [Methylocystis sp. ATCC 49242]